MINQLKNTCRKVRGQFAPKIGGSFDWILQESAGIHFNKQNNAANIVMEYAYLYPVPKTIHLIKAAFPIVYESFKNGNPFAWIPNLFFKDSDKCKALRENLISQYLNSKWPPAGLFIIALRSDFLWDLIRILTQNKIGNSFIRTAIKDLKSMEKSKEITFLLNELESLK